MGEIPISSSTTSFHHAHSKLQPGPGLIMPWSYKLVRGEKVHWLLRYENVRCPTCPGCCPPCSPTCSPRTFVHSFTKTCRHTNLFLPWLGDTITRSHDFLKKSCSKTRSENQLRKNILSSPSYAHAKFHMSVVMAQHIATCSQYTHDTVMMPAGPDCKK